MFFEETISAYKEVVESAVDELYDTAFSNQVNENDLLLVLENGLRKDYNEVTLKRLNISPYQIGPDFIGLRYDTFYQFINHYRNEIKSKEEFSKESVGEGTRESLLNFYRDFQLLLYMKFWETDLILRRLLNLSNLAQGISYNWEYSQKVFDKRRDLIRKDIQTPIKEKCPLFYKLIEEIYFSQIRNAVAHSQYYYLYNSIYFTNKNENPYYKLNGISHADWEILFTKVILLYNFTIKNFNKYQSLYQYKVRDKQNGLIVYFPEHNFKGSQKSGWLRYESHQKRWLWDN